MLKTYGHWLHESGDNYLDLFRECTGRPLDFFVFQRGLISAAQKQFVQRISAVYP